MEFSDMGLGEKTLLALAKLNYVEPTEVQVKAIPQIISGRNLIVRSHTGTGKTAAFGIGIIERIAAGKSKKALILTPTRELAVQVCKELRGIGQLHELRITVAYGGASINIQLDELRDGVDILVATPGRLIDLTQRGAVRIGEFDIAILDEADQMLDMGFIDDVTMILDQLPKHRMTLLLSATLDESIMSIAQKYVHAPMTIEIGEIEAAETIKQEHVETTDREKFPRLLEVLREHANMKILIFRETKLGSSRLQERLWQRGFRAGVLQGDMTQAARNKMIADFKEGRIMIMVATNVAARGLHIDNLGLIVNYDKAQSEEIHLHRIGRTGRMGQEGKAINFIQRKESLDERMSENHPDFAWMKQGGLESFRQGRTERRGYGHGSPSHSGSRYGGRRGPPRHNPGGAHPHSAHGTPHTHDTGGSRHQQGESHSSHGHEGRRHERRRRPHSDSG